MPLDDLSPWDRYELRDVDMSDIYGIPGLEARDELAERVGRMAGGTWRQLGPATSFFLSGRNSGNFRVTDQVGGFGSTAGPILAELNAAVPAGEPPFSADHVIARRESVTGDHLVAHQQVRGAEVVGARYRVHSNTRGQVTVSGRPLGDLAKYDPGPQPAVAPEEAAIAIRHALNVPLDCRIHIDRKVFPVQGTGLWVFEGRFYTDDPAADVRAFVRMDDLQILLSYNVASRALYGEALVFEVNPGRTPQRTSVRLERLGPFPTDRLSGGAIQVRTHDGSGAMAANRDWRVDDGDPRLEEVSAYYFLSEAIRWCGGILGDTLFTAAPFSPLKAVVRHPSERDNALFMPTPGEIRFGEGRRPTSLSGDVVFHEFGHAVIDAVCRLNRSSLDESRALVEGYCDYIAASAFNDPRIADWVSDNPEGLRNCAKPGVRFPADLKGSRYEIGAAWAAVLWGIRDRLGASVADLLALESLQFLGPDSTVEDARAALLRADQQLFPAQSDVGRHQGVIEEEYAKRAAAPDVTPQSAEP